MEAEHKPVETLYLIDGHAQIFRAYYAIRGGLRSAVTGEPTHAVFGFTGMLFAQTPLSVSPKLCRSGDGYARQDVSRRSL